MTRSGAVAASNPGFLRNADIFSPRPGAVVRGCGERARRKLLPGSMPSFPGRGNAGCETWKIRYKRAPGVCPAGGAIPFPAGSELSRATHLRGESISDDAWNP